LDQFGTLGVMENYLLFFWFLSDEQFAVLGEEIMLMSMRDYCTC
jgi:hypothetical protein